MFHIESHTSASSDSDSIMHLTSYLTFCTLSAPSKHTTPSLLSPSHLLPQQALVEINEGCAQGFTMRSGGERILN